MAEAQVQKANVLTLRDARVFFRKARKNAELGKQELAALGQKIVSREGGSAPDLQKIKVLVDENAEAVAEIQKNMPYGYKLVVRKSMGPGDLMANPYLVLIGGLTFLVMGAAAELVAIPAAAVELAFVALIPIAAGSLFTAIGLVRCRQVFSSNYAKLAGVLEAALKLVKPEHNRGV